MCPSAYRVSGLSGSRGEGGHLHQNLPWTGGDVLAKFHKDRCMGLDFILALHVPTDQQTNRQTNICTPVPFLYLQKIF